MTAPRHALEGYSLISRHRVRKRHCWKSRPNQKRHQCPVDSHWAQILPTQSMRRRAATDTELSRE